MDTYCSHENNDYDDDCFDTSDGKVHGSTGMSHSGWNTSHPPTVVRVYQPMQYGQFPKKPTLTKSNVNLTSTFIGGSRTCYSADSLDDCIKCAICQDALYPLVNYYNSIQGYTIQVFACNRSSCYRTLFPFVSDDHQTSSATAIDAPTRNGLHYGGNGVVVARRIIVSNQNTASAASAVAPFAEPQAEMETSRNEWTSTDIIDDGIESSNNNKGDDIDDNADNMDFDELESQLAAIEARGSTMPSSLASSVKKNTKKTKNNSAPQMDGFPCYMLHGLQEPPAVQQYTDAMQDKDDVGLSGNSTSKNDQHKIQQMLQQYMEEMEDDVDILNLLQQQQQSSSTSYNGNFSKQDKIKNHMERDERLSVMDRALFTYTDRLKRIPRQVLRHGSGTVPLWSIPIISLQQQQKQLPTNQQGNGNRASSSKHQPNAAISHRNNKKNEIYGYEKPIPSCRHCGTHLRFELQILSSILHVLNVDDFAAEDITTTTGGGGMDWGNICVYTCPNQVSKCLSDDVFCIVQDSIDHVYLPNNNSANTNNTIMHQQQQSATSTAAAVVIPENTQFDQDDDDDGIVLVGDEYENECDDDDSVW